MARILTVDIETMPAKAWIWRMFDETVHLERLIEPSRVLCFGAKWLGEDKTLFYSEWKDGDDMFERAFTLLDEADVVVTYNGNRFDLPRLRQQLLIGGHQPPSPAFSVDLFAVVKRQFGAGFDSKKLAHVLDELDLDNKHQHSGFDIWPGCADGDKAAQREMTKYCKQDVVATEALYERIKAWIPNHPNLATVEGDEDGCPVCRSTRYKSHGWTHTQASSYRRYRCKNCGHVFRDKRREQYRDASQFRRA